MGRQLAETDDETGKAATGASEAAVPEERMPLPAVSLDRLAHELRTPLAAIQSTADALAGGHLGPLDQRLAGYVASIADTARHALAVVDGMLAVPPPHDPDRGPGPLDLAAVAGRVVTSMASLAQQAGVHLALRQPECRAEANAAETDVRRMLINLVINGITHTGREATVIVSSGVDATGAPWLEVSDDGPGIAPEKAVALGGVLQPDLPAGAGARGARTRHGLAVAHALAGANGGRLELRSGPLGTTARLVLRPVTA
ncbi:MAG: sensor histidine kinase [Hyphomicrobiaceae bacterium]